MLSESADMVPQASDAVACGPLWVSPQEMCEARVRGERITLSPPSLRALGALLAAGGKVLSRSEIQTAATGRSAPGSRAADVRILRIRRTLGDVGNYIIAVPGRGYRIDVLGLASFR